MPASAESCQTGPIMAKTRSSMGHIKSEAEVAAEFGLSIADWEQLMINLTKPRPTMTCILCGKVAGCAELHCTIRGKCCHHVCRECSAH